jgi:hypothetical protein
VPWLSLQVQGNEVISIMSFMSNHVILVKSSHSSQIMSFMSNHVILSNYVIHFGTCKSNRFTK